MPTRKAEATWEGGLKGGKGSFKGESGVDRAGRTPSARASGGAAGTNPEELLAAARGRLLQHGARRRAGGQRHARRSASTPTPPAPSRRWATASRSPPCGSGPAPASPGSTRDAFQQLAAGDEERLPRLAGARGRGHPARRRARVGRPRAPGAPGARSPLPPPPSPVSILARTYRDSLALLDRSLRDHHGLRVLEGGPARRRRPSSTSSSASPPFDGGFAVACGIASRRVEYLEQLRFADDDLGVPRRARGRGRRSRSSSAAFLDYLRGLRFACDIDVVPEGTVVFPHEPLVRVRGPIIQAQILETALLNLVNFQTLVATKAARICLAAQGEPVLEFGLRRAQGIDGGLSRQPGGVRGRLRRPPRTSWPASSSASRCAARTPTAG